MSYRKKLIEVALPLEAINREAVRESYIYRGNPSAIHKWWTQKPFAVARTVLFASIVDDPESRPDEFPTARAQDVERQRLFSLIERLAVWEASSDDALMTEVRQEIRRATSDDQRPVAIDPFAGGATLALEAQRLGLGVEAAELNPVAALITKALVQLPQRFAGRAPAHPEAGGALGHGGDWPRSSGLAEDVRRYGEWMREEAARRLGANYPEARLEDGSTAPVIAWLWARTVTCPNPACGMTTPLASSFTLSSRRGRERWACPTVDRVGQRVTFTIRLGRAPITATISRTGGRCLGCDAPIPLAHIRSEGRNGRLGVQLLAMVTSVDGKRTYVSPTDDQESAALSIAVPDDVLDIDLPTNPRAITPPNYGMTRHRDLYTSRQLLTLQTLGDLVGEAAKRVRRDSSGDDAYARAVATYLAFVVDKVAQFNSALVLWFSQEDRQTHTFGRQTLSMAWNFAEGNVFAGIGGGIDVAIRTVADALAGVPTGVAPARVLLGDAAAILARSSGPRLITTDPPYYDNVPYADLSDFFYVWLRRSLRPVDPAFLDTILVPKAEELISEPARFGGDKRAARDFFESGMRRFFDAAVRVSDERFPTTVYYAFKQAETRDVDGRASTGWETMLSGLVQSGYQITGTWPTRTERGGRLRDTGSNALASSIVLVCRVRDRAAPLATRKELVRSLRHEMPAALRALQHGTLHLSIWRRRRLGQAWRCSPGIRRSSRPTGLRRPSEARSA